MTYQPTDEQIEGLGAYWLTEPEWQDDKFRDDWVSDFRDLTASPSFQSIIRAAQAEAWARGYVDRLGDAPRYDAPSQWPNPYREAPTA